MNISPEERVSRAVDLFMQGYGCCQSVVAAFADLYGFTDEQAKRVAAGWGGGVGRMRLMCGAVSALVILAGMDCGQTEGGDREGKAACYRVVQDLVGEFSRQNGSITCAELLHLKPEAVAKARAALNPRDATVKAPTDDGTPSYIPSERTQQYYKTRPCAAKVECAARIYAQHLCRKSHES